MATLNYGNFLSFSNSSQKFHFLLIFQFRFSFYLISKSSGKVYRRCLLLERFQFNPSLFEFSSMIKLQSKEVKFRKQTSIYHNFKVAGDDFFLSLKSHEDLPNSSDIRYIRMSTAFSTSFGFLLIYFLIFDNRYVLVSHFTFLLIIALHLVIEIVKYTSYSNANQNFSLTFENFCNFIASYAMLIVCSYVISVLFGADLYENIGATLIFSCHISSFVFIPLYFHVGDRFMSLIMIEGKPKTPIEFCDLIVCAGVLVGAWFGAFVIPLDWDRDWQKWPIPCVISSILGFTASNIFLLVCTFLNRAYLAPMFNIPRIKPCST